MTVMRRLAAVLAAVAVGAAAAVTAVAAAAPAEAKPSYGQIEGSGSSWAYNAVNTWAADVGARGIRVTFTRTGSAQSRKDFANQTTDFAVTDIGFQGTDPQSGASDTNQGRPYAYVPIAAGGTAFPYNLSSNGARITNLRLSPLLVSAIFAGDVPFWDDPRVQADNPGIVLPHTPVIPVVHSEGSGATFALTSYLATLFPGDWTPTEYFPASGADVAENGSDQVINTIVSAGADGTIGYDEYSYAKLNAVPVGKLLNAAGYYTAPTQYNVAVALQAAAITMDPSSPDYLLANLTSVYTEPDPQAYPLSGYSYLVEPTGATTPSASSPDPEVRMTSGKRHSLADFIAYSVCVGQGEVGPIGYSALPYNLVAAALAQVAKLGQVDPSVDLGGLDIAQCANPTFNRNDPSQNVLVALAPLPPACDQLGAPNCSAATSATATQTAMSVLPLGHGSFVLNAAVTPGGAPGAVVFLDGGGPITGPTPVDGSGNASAPVSLGNGQHSLTAAFAPSDPGFAPSTSPPLALSVSGVVTTQPGDPQSVEATVPPGSLLISAPYTPESPLNLGTLQPIAGGTMLSASAQFASQANPIRVIDTRAGDLLWTASAISSPLDNGGSGLINAQNLGLTNLQYVESPGNALDHSNVAVFDNPAAHGVPVADPGHLGLGGTTAHPIATATQGFGTIGFFGTMILNAPTSTPRGVYTGTVVFTVG
jgi:ABC-type phosphate transport system substrate-binding protein